MSSAQHRTKTTSWITVGLICVATVILAFAMVFQNLPLAILGVILGAAGAILGVVGGIMDDAH